jgi:hypothetical protein
MQFRRLRGLQERSVSLGLDVEGAVANEGRPLYVSLVFNTRKGGLQAAMLRVADPGGETLKRIKFIRSPQEGELGVEMIRLLAKEEGEEIAFQGYATGLR